MKLNIGAGGRKYEGFTNVDIVARQGVDIVAEMSKIPLPDASAEEIMAIHVVEHVHSWEVPIALKEWNRLMKSGGRLILELPDIIKCCKNLLHGVMLGGKHPHQLSYWGIYGDDRARDPFMQHKYGWTFKTLKPLVSAAGFENIHEAETQFHPCGRNSRDFRLEARKPLNV